MIGGILLAAGESSRLGISKQLVQFQGKTLLENTFEAMQPLDTVVVVLGAREHQHLAVLPEDCITILNTDWKLGMGNSIKKGLALLLQLSTNLEGILISVCDQPYLNQDHIQSMKEQFLIEPSTAVASSYAGSLGVPVIFPKSCFEQILEINDLAGAKKVIETCQNPFSIPFENGEIDIDTIEDLNSLKGSSYSA